MQSTPPEILLSLVASYALGNSDILVKLYYRTPCMMAHSKDSVAT